MAWWAREGGLKELSRMAIRSRRRCGDVVDVDVDADDAEADSAFGDNALRGQVDVDRYVKMSARPTFVEDAIEVVLLK